MAIYIKDALKGKNPKQVLKMISTGEIHQYYANQDEKNLAVAEALHCSIEDAQNLIKKSDTARAQSFSASHRCINLPKLVAAWIN